MRVLVKYPNPCLSTWVKTCLYLALSSSDIAQLSLFEFWVWFFGLEGKEEERDLVSTSSPSKSGWGSVGISKLGYYVVILKISWSLNK